MARKKKTIEEYKADAKKNAKEKFELNKKLKKNLKDYQEKFKGQESIIAEQQNLLAHSREIEVATLNLDAKLSEVMAHNRILEGRLTDMGISNTSTLENIATVMERITRPKMIDPEGECNTLINVGHTSSVY